MKVSYDSQKPYNELPLLPPIQELENKNILKKAIAANKALAELNCLSALLPNSLVLVNVIGLQEAKLSSEIENVVTTNDALYKAYSNELECTDPQTKEVLRYKEALWHGYLMLEEGRPISIRLMEELYRIVKQAGGGIRKHSGTKLSNMSGKIIYTPPEGEEVIREKLKNLEQYINDDFDADIDPLIKLPIIHYQFEAIHPFSDGNGRVGRIINILYLIDKGLLTYPVLYLSKYIIENKEKYYSGLRKVTEDGKWEEWILYILSAVEYTAKLTKEKILKIKEQFEADVELIKEQLPKFYSKDLLEVIYEHPYCKISFLEKRGVAKRQTASKYLKALSELGVLKAVKVGKEYYYINEKFLQILIS
jgi:Uncharacterized conserved protein